MKPNDLIASSYRQAKQSPKKPRQADLKRAVSTAYYAMFHALARDVADKLVGTGTGVSQSAWRQAYRALEHARVKEACKQAKAKGFPAAVVGFANAFVSLQEERHKADYDPYHSLSRATAISLVATAEAAIAGLKGAATKDRKAFCVWVVLRDRA